MKMNWGTGIVLSFVGFTAVLVTMVTISMKEDVSLVATDYYKQEINYQSQIDKQKNYRDLAEKPLIKLDASRNYLQVQFPAALLGAVQSGELHMFRPSAADMDKKYALKLDEAGAQSVAIPDLPKGMWKAKLTWQSTDKAYYTETILNK